MLLETESTDGLEQHIGKARHEEAKLIGPPAVTTGAVSKQVELLLLDTVLHLTACTVDLVVEALGRAAQVRHDVSADWPPWRCARLSR